MRTSNDHSSADLAVVRGEINNVWGHWDYPPALNTNSKSFDVRWATTRCWRSPTAGRSRRSETAWRCRCWWGSPGRRRSALQREENRPMPWSRLRTNGNDDGGQSRTSFQDVGLRVVFPLDLGDEVKQFSHKSVERKVNILKMHQTKSQLPNMTAVTQEQRKLCFHWRTH